MFARIVRLCRQFSSRKTVTKVDADGELVWSYTGKGPNAVAVDADGNVYSGGR